MGGRDTKGELQDVYYIPDNQTRRTSYSELFLQGWQPHLGRSSFTLHDWKGDLITDEPMSNNVFTVTL